jgi:TRAP-type C4-dicarboxylate transport system substrate-binding protein
MLAAGCAALFLFPGMEAQASTTWDMAIVYPAGNYQSVAAERFAAAVEEATGGEVSIQVHTGGALGFKGPEMLATIRDGLVPIGTMLLNQQAGLEPLLGIASLPFIASGSDEMRIIDEITRPAYEEIARRNNQKILYIIPWPGQNIFAKEEVKVPADFRDLKIRTVDRNGSDYFRSLDASPAQMPWGEVVPALATGVINSVTTSSSSGVDGQFWEFMSFVHLVNWQTNFDMVTVNLDAWNKLSSEVQAAIEAAAQKLEPEFWSAAMKEDEEKLDLLSQRGVSLIQPSEEVRAFMIDRGIPSWEAFSEQVAGARELIEAYRARAGK